ncbi:hypothetical protein [Echinicola sp. 20G]|uniref:hypothetical protein n=1 Tax=Echinicola sp. 20G TaxID=2781961 RepID=UPI001910D292|nr:hypothetical protein [Echinicola sp. 20G]
MDLEQLRKDFMPKELVMKLFVEIPKGHWEKKFKVLDAYFRSIKDQMDPDVFFIRTNQEYGFFSWEAGKYWEAVHYYEQAISRLAYEDYEFLYHNISSQLIRCNGLVGNTQKALEWLETALMNKRKGDNLFHLLDLMREYWQILVATKGQFDDRYLKYIQEVSLGLGFSIELSDPLTAIKEMDGLNKEWNHKLQRIGKDTRDNVSLKKQHLEKFKGECPIAWYQDYAAKALERIG